MGSLSLDICIGFKTNIPRECDGHMRIGLGLDTGGFRGTKDKGNSFTFSDQDLGLCVRSHEAGGRYEEHCLMLLRLGLGLLVKANFAQGSTNPHKTSPIKSDCHLLL